MTEYKTPRLASRRTFYGRLRLLCLLAMASTALSVFGADISDSSAIPFLIRSWQHEQGLPNNTVNAITQTHDGYLWLATDEGLARFDGEHCRVYGLQDGLQNLQISALLEDSRQVLWIGTSGGGLARMVHGQIQAFTSKDGLAGDSISSFIEDNHGDVWVATHTGLSRWQDGHFISLATNLNPMFVYDLAKDKEGDIWAATLHNGLLRFHNDTCTVAKIDQNPRCVLIDSKGRVWAGVRERVMLCYDHGNWIRYGTNDGFPEIITSHIAETADGTIWVGSLNEGLYYFQNGRFNALQKRDGLSDNAILSLFASREKFLWVGTQSGGMNRIGPKKLFVCHVMDGTSEAQLRSMAQTTNRTIWVGTFGQGMYSWDGELFQPLLDKIYRDHLLVEAVLSARDGSVWWGAGPVLSQLNDGKLKAHFADTSWLTADRVWSLCEDRNGGIWVGTYNGKIGLLKQSKFNQIKGFSGKPITALAQERGGALWIGSLGGGLARFENGKLTVLTTKEGLQSDLIRTLLLETNGTLWIGTDGGGLNRWSQGKMTGFTTQQGMLDNTILQILDDDEGCLWLGCNQGISRVSKLVLDKVAKGKSTSVHSLDFGMSDGLASEECVGNFGAALRSRSGLLYFATAKGIVVIDPRQQNHLGPPPTALVENVFVDKIALPYVDWQMASNNLGRLAVIPAGNHAFEFQYTGINFEAPEKIRFRYQLEGWDPAMIEAGDVRSVHYGYLPPGTYHFHVQACNANGQWNEPGATVSFQVGAFFWQMFWFRALTVCLLLGLLAVGIRVVERRRYRARLRRLEQERAMERERGRIARDLHDELGSSLTYISMSITDIGQSKNNNADDLKARAEKISGFATRTARALDEIVWAVNPRNDTLRSLLEYLTELARELFENTDTHCRFQFPADLPALPLPPEMRHNLFLTVKEALTNTLKHAHATEVLMSAKPDSQHIEICLQDNGVGFTPQTSRPAGEHNGLENMRRRVETIGGQFTIESTPGKGSLIRIIIPLPAGASSATKSSK